MGRILSGLVVALLIVGLADAATAAKTITVTGKLTAGAAQGSNVNATVTVNGTTVTGDGAISGKNPQTNTSYSYAFKITAIKTETGSISLLGRLANNGPEICIKNAVPSGAMTVTYKLSNGSNAVSTGTGSVTVK